MIINFTNDVCDKTFQEIYNAFMNGEGIITTFEDGSTYLITGLWLAETQNYNEYGLSVGYNNYTTDTLTGYPSLPDYIDNNEG